MNTWAYKMAWRDSRGSRRRLLLFLSSMVLGVAALVAIESFGTILRETVDEQAKALLGADLSLESGKPFTSATEALIDSLGGEQSRRISFSSMALFPRTEDTRLVTVRAVEGDYPFYGAIETTPPSAARTYLRDRDALVDATLLEQYDVRVGDSVRIGTISYQIAGRLEKTPRESAAVMLFSPRVFIPMDRLDESLLDLGSRAEYEVYFKFPPGTDAEAIEEEIEPHLDEHNLGSDTVEEIKEDWNEGLTNLYRFLSLVGFIALLLGGLGVASSVHVYVKQRVETVAVLRCLGAKSWRTVSIYLIQAFLLGLIGGMLGCLAGLAVQLAIPRVLADFLPMQVSFDIVWSAIGLGLGIGVAVTVLFALLPLVRIRKVSPLLAIRSSVDEEVRGHRDPLQWGIFLLIASGIVGFALAQAPDWRYGLGYAGGILAVFGLLAIVAKIVIVLTRRYFPASWSYVWRQGLANLYRPNNQTTIMVLALGLGTFLIVTLFLVQHTLINQIQIAGGENQPSMVLFDIQPDQLEGVEEVVTQHGLPILDQVPIVTMRLAAVKGETIEAMEQDSTRDLGWAHRREYRSTYRDHLTDSEIVLEGEFVGTMPVDAGDPTEEGGTAAVPVSIEQEIAHELAVGIGDSLVFNVQGIDMRTVVSSIREVDWRQLSTNFFVVFPEGPLDEAPQFHVLLTRVPGDEASAEVQSAIVQQYPNVSAIDLSLILNTFNAIFSRVSFVIRFMALFSILTGLIVLAGAVVVSRYQRTEESVLLKTLGASRWQVFKILLIEYFFLGLFAALTGIILALAAAWSLARFLFEAPFAPDYAALALSLIVVIGVTMLVGLLNSRGIYDRPPLEVLRAEV